jgi:dynactin 1
LPVIRRLIFFHPTEAKEVQVREHLRKIESLEETCVDYEGTIQQFRELVLQLQMFVPIYFLLAATLMVTLSFSFTSSELDQLRTETQTAQSESASAASRAANVMSLNLKLQTSVQKNQARTIDLEVKSIEAKECKELLSIVQVCHLFSGHRLLRIDHAFCL